MLLQVRGPASAKARSLNDPSKNMKINKHCQAFLAVSQIIAVDFLFLIFRYGNKKSIDLPMKLFRDDFYVGNVPSA